MKDARAITDSLTEIHSPYVRDFQKRGGKVLGYCCDATPVEVIEAAGILPYRIKAFGNSETFLADGEMSLLNCSFCRSCLQLGMDGTYGFLDGVVETNGCDHMRVMFENWQRVCDPGFFHYLKVPHNVSEDSIRYFEGELRLLLDSISSHFSVRVKDEDLLEVMGEREKVRAEWARLTRLRRMDSPTVTGCDMLALSIQGSSMFSCDFASLLGEFRSERESGPGLRPRARLMLCGAATDELAWFEEIEAMGGVIVADALCFGSRALCQEVPGEGPTLRRLAGSYLESLFCPRMYAGYQGRRDYILEAARAARVDGVVVLYNKFCDLHGVDAVLLRKDLEAEGFPVQVLEKEYSARSDLGRIKTRIQAFLERIGGGGA